jgi:5'-deoxynucleotidase
MKHFYAYLSRMKFIQRWGLMRNTQQENDMEHALQAALIAHGLAVLAATRYHRQVDPEHVMALAVYHDAGEVITGDLPTPVKYHNPFMRTEYKKLEDLAAKTLLNMLPEDMQSAYQPYLTHAEDNYEWRLVKAADRICAYIKCVEEEKAGNTEFHLAKASVLKSIQEIELPEVQAFMAEFVPSFALSLDELSGGGGL